MFVKKVCHPNAAPFLLLHPVQPGFKNKLLAALSQIHLANWLSNLYIMYSNHFPFGIR